MPDPVVSSADVELRPHVERALGALYELDCEIGRGGMGIVYRAKDRRLKRTVAIKVLPPELAYLSETKQRFVREAQLAAQLNHPNIVDIYNVDEAGQLVYFVMAYILGDNLAKRVHDVGPLEVNETRRILRDVADALAYAHQRGVIHRDIKPDNILLDSDSGRPMVTDFGIARAVADGNTRLTATGQMIGTPTYMSPEQVAGDREIDGRSDLYSLGIVAYQMLSGQPPFAANSSMSLMLKQLNEKAIPIEERRRDLPPELARIIMTLLEKDPEARFPSAGALVAALDGGWTPIVGSSLPRSSDASVAAPVRPSLAAGVPPAPAPSGTGSAYFDPFSNGPYTPTGEELARWENPAVKYVRARVGPYLYINGALLLLRIVGVVPSDLSASVTFVWTIYIAYKYAKMWQAGFDWHDVFRQPQDRSLVEVGEDAVTYARGLFDPHERARMRLQRQALRAARRSGGTGVAQMSAPFIESAVQAAGSHGEQLRRAFADRDEILRILDRMPPADRARVPDVARSASTLAGKAQALAISLATLEERAGPEAAIQSEIDRLEADANPLDQAASDTRVRRLAYLRRELRKTDNGTERRKAIEARLGDCLVALQSMKIDVLRLSTGADTHQHVTSLALQALVLARSVDTALAATDQSPPSNNSSQPPRSSASPG